MLNRLALGIGISLLAGLLVMGWLWRNAAENAQEAAQEAKQLEADLRVALESERRTRELDGALQAVLTAWQFERSSAEADLTETRKTLEQIRANARKETADESLACAVRPVPDDVDRLLVNPAED